MDYEQMTAPCGLDCFNCPLYLANQNKKLRTLIAERMHISPEKAVCEGCRNANGTIAFLDMTEPCSAFACFEKRGISLCCDCPEFPCDRLHPYADKASQFPHNTKVFNLCLIKKMGLEAWAKEKAKMVKDTYFKGTFTL